MGKQIINTNATDMSLFCNRLITEMQLHGYKTRRALATVLFDRGLIKVNHKPNFESEKKNRDNAIGSIEKTIQGHCGAATAEKVKSQYIVAYSTVFNCSADYLLGLSDIKNKDIEVREICEKSGLSENAWFSIVEAKVETAWLSDLIESGLTHELFKAWISMSQQWHVHLLNSKRTKPYEEIINELEVKDQLHMIQHPSFKAKVKADDAYSAYYGKLFEMNMHINQYFIEGTQKPEGAV